MKRTNLLIALMLLAAASLFWKCGDNSPAAVNPRDAQLTKLTKTWKATSVTMGGSPRTGYESFVLTASGTAGNPVFSYTTSGRPASPATSPWPKDGKFTFGTDFATTIVREDNITVTYSVTATQLQLTFNYKGTGFTNTRTGNVEGDWVFNFDAQ